MTSRRTARSPLLRPSRSSSLVPASDKSPEPTDVELMARAALSVAAASAKTTKDESTTVHGHSSLQWRSQLHRTEDELTTTPVLIAPLLDETEAALDLKIDIYKDNTDNHRLPQEQVQEIQNATTPTNLLAAKKSWIYRTSEAAAFQALKHAIINTPPSVNESIPAVSSMVVVRRNNKIRLNMYCSFINKQKLETPTLPLSTLEETATRINGSQYCTLLDCKKGFWQVKVKKDIKGQNVEEKNTLTVEKEMQAESCNGEKRDANNTISGKSKNGVGFKADLGNGNCVTTLNWFLHSGATDHMTNTNCGEAITARKAGNVKGYLVVNGKLVECIIKNVLFVPNLQHNLMSITCLETSGLKTVFENSKAVIYKQSEIVGVAKRQCGLYELEIYLDTKTANANLSLHEKGDLWHKRYGHIGNESLQKIINLDMVNGIEILNIKNTEKCETCIYGKMTKLPHKNTKGRANEPLELIPTWSCHTRSLEWQKVYSARNTRERRRPTWFDDYDMSCLAMNQEPEKFEEIVIHSQRIQWEHAMENKMKCKHWSKIKHPLPECKKAIHRKWINKIKVDGNGDTHYKGRLCLTTIRSSSTKAEYIALAGCVAEGVWLKNLLEKMCVFEVNEPFVVYEDNHGCIFLFQNPSDFKRSKHIDIIYHFIRDKVSQGIIKIVYCSTNEQIADILTKSLGSSRDHLRLQEAEEFFLRAAQRRRRFYGAGIRVA
ncbi:hypothetical protein ILUMI_05188 [Ignelater luminosus]|uniref:GAG-pre-integrase domain-containing protein n=1 Tax=Ignelater luminosus TaxID=2038154 RepID=A0A8K0D7R7_IGNLU|nr:hypothetical protein ILUMI_05188 [Ignelater luminosus]